MILFENFYFTYDGEEKSSLTNINLKINEGECVIITGLSGCGKTTLLRIINGLCPSVFQGSALGTFKTRFYDYNNSFAAFNSAYTASILQNPKSGFLFSNAEEECTYSAKCIGKGKEEIGAKLKECKEKYTQLLLHKNILNISSGEAQTLSILSSLIKTPKIIVMDEPTANLDINEITNLKRHINELKKNNVTIVIAEHRVGYLKDICDAVYVMQDGRLIDDEKYEIRNHNISFLRSVQANPGIKKDNLNISNLNYRIKNNIILKNVHVSINSSMVTAIVGKNGSGKTTLGKLIAGLIQSKKSVFTLNDKILSTKDRINMSYFCMQESYHQMVTGSVKEEILLQNNQLTDFEIKSLLELVDMSDFENKHPSKLSGGQVLRLAVLLAYISNNKIIVLDEPTSGLDFKRMKLICKLIKKMREEGRFIFLISHDLELLSEVADEYILLEQGKIIEHKKLDTQNDFKQMISQILNKKKIEENVFITKENNTASKINPVVNLIVFFTIANAVFFYPVEQSSVYLMLLTGIIIFLNKNYMLLVKMVIFYFLLAKVKMFCPLYYQVFIEIFLMRGTICAYALKNITANTKLITIIESLEKIKLTDYILIPVISLLRLFPMMRYDSSIAYMSLKTRKLIKNRSPVAVWNFIIVPIVFSLIRSAENLSCGIETKGMIINKKRTILTQDKFKLTDYILSITYIAIYTFLFIGEIKWITN
ncbi:ATP-binding cassette domain-containing protein [Treponema sp. OMZ 788]|uniref:ATP-binding cassette domain-containing protein n=1 Tax=Treponema sp. OMZ 788 TaxID=2563664 RepID=UPI0020A2B67E|nr:ATP-binding cassette domain-containing protein [Treponema sp. OMZ 788]UTC64004.1 ATP-binding cassette domain-containing protein [Treponema sp. OMZ 788]